ncbi:uncharacterized protein METZ01_LOCUS159392 [marine metagenome]|uniref:Uncharacterized protein n=1 Tax=marine metagenome TaxID=408172 RepID=A0A382AYL2_9ZZZZ
MNILMKACIFISAESESEKRLGKKRGSDSQVPIKGTKLSRKLFI